MQFNIISLTIYKMNFTRN